VPGGVLTQACGMSGALASVLRSRQEIRPGRHRQPNALTVEEFVTSSMRLLDPEKMPFW
jgi:hypothetical protein